MKYTGVSTTTTLPLFRTFGSVTKYRIQKQNEKTRSGSVCFVTVKVTTGTTPM